jgi:hypothetical protein
MSWLNEKKKQFDAAEAERLAKEQKDREERDSRCQSAYNELKMFVKNTLADLEGKETKDGKQLRIKFDNERHSVTMYAGENEKFLYLHFWYKENEKYDGDGCSWGDGTYYLKEEVHYIRPHKDKCGYEKPEGKWGALYEDDLAHYLLTFVKI